MSDDSSDTKRGLNYTGYTGLLYVPTEEDIDTLVQWLVDSNTKGADELMPMPEWYKPFIAYYQLSAMNATNNGSLAPWQIPPEWIERLSTVWLCSLKATKLLNDHASAAKVDRSRLRKPQTQKQSEYPIVKTDSHGGNA